jgi:hypothetical protein
MRLTVQTLGAGEVAGRDALVAIASMSHGSWFGSLPISVTSPAASRVRPVARKSP